MRDPIRRTEWRRPLRFVMATYLLLAWSRGVQAEIPGLHDWAEATVGSASPAQQGPIAPIPDTRLRPQHVQLMARSQFLPLAVHAAPDVDPRQALAALAALEGAYRWLLWTQWPVPPADGGAGNTLEFDLYLVPDSPGLAGAGYDVLTQHDGLDGALTFAWVDPNVAQLDACVTSALVEATLLALDPAESASWRRATAHWFTWQVHGHYGCQPAATTAHHRPSRGWFATNGGDAGVLLWNLLSDRADGGSGTFWRELWQLTRQRTRYVKGLRATPTLWHALQKSLANAGESLEEIMVDVGVARFFAGAPERRAAAPYPSLRALPVTAAVSVTDPTQWSALPVHGPPHALHALGHHYMQVDVRDAPPEQTLDIWLRGEVGPRWSLTAVRLDARGRELGRVQAPVRNGSHSYLPVSLTPDTAHVLLVATCLPPWFEAFDPATDATDDQNYYFQWIVGRNGG